MGFKQLFIQNRSYLSYQHNLLHIKNENIDTTVCLDDIDIVIIENTQTTISTALLSNLAKKDIALICVDEKFMPASLSLGLYKNSRTTKIQKAQLNTSQPKLNRLWKDIIISKITNQSKVLNTQISSKDAYLITLSQKVTSADKTNIEAKSASYYFRHLFDKAFCRKDEDDTRNIALNYGYTIFRSTICRYLIAYGLNPSFGLWHSSELNAYNLADDLLEPFRPIIDFYVIRHIKSTSNFTTQHKRDLVGLLNFIVYDNDEDKQILLKDAMKDIVSSYQSFCLDKRDSLKIFVLEL